ncbi:putative transmembrane protein [Methyloligella halotolerans]|uniref:Putative transmembrane protein n=2 Tax=Methyloligella halotolerans TaxID=1177755 RepID=A0A1E2RXX4_9HYPH|nr:putative transmembrane protein [Methyloligella halotolerans]
MHHTRRVAFGIALGVSAAMAATAAPAQTPQGPDEIPTERVHSDISTREIAIKSNFTGIEIVIFGAVDYAPPDPKAPPYDVIMVIRGPTQDVVARRKERFAGIWLNGSSKVFHDIPGFYAVLSSRPLRAIAPEETLNELKVGFTALDLGPDDHSSVSDDLFRQAVIRNKEERLLFQYLDNAVSFIGRSLFRGTVDMPVNVPIGVYTAEVLLFQDGKLLSKDESTLNVQKVGFERGVYILAFRHPVIYGLLAVAIALLMGLGAWALFRRD